MARYPSASPPAVSPEAALLLWDTAVFAYLPVLLLCALVTGAVTGGAAALLLRRFTGGRDGAPQQ